MRYIDPSNKVLNHLDHIIAIKNGRKMPPVNIEVDLTNRCSLGCEWCHFAYTHTRGPLANKRDKPENAISGGDVMGGDFALRLVTQLYDYGVKSITWTGGGEPTLHPHFNDIISYTRRYLAQGIYTNGAHIDEERAAIMKSSMSWVYISLDECGADSYAASKGVDKFHDVVGDVKRLTVATGEATIGVGFMLHSDNYQDIPYMKDLALDELGADYVQFRPTIRYEQETPGELTDNAEWITEAMALLGTIKDNPKVYANPERFRMYRDWNGHGYDTCHFSALQTVITPNGKVWGCVNKREHSGALLGDLTQETFANIWRRSEAQKVNGDCRLMCRGHMANLTLDAIMSKQPHEEFI